MNRLEASVGTIATTDAEADMPIWLRHTFRDDAGVSLNCTDGGSKSFLVALNGGMGVLPRLDSVEFLDIRQLAPPSASRLDREATTRRAHAMTAKSVECTVGIPVPEGTSSVKAKTKTKTKTICLMTSAFRWQSCCTNQVLRGWTAYLPGSVGPRLPIPAHDRLASGLRMVAAQTPQHGLEGTPPPLLQRRMVATRRRSCPVQSRLGSHHPIPSPGDDDPVALAQRQLRSATRTSGSGGGMALPGIHAN